MEPIATSKKSSSQKNFITILVLLVILLGGTSAYLYKKSMKQQTVSDQAALAEAKSLADKVGKLILLPAGETPTVATVSDPNALKNQSFFADVQKGDKVLIYTNAKKAVLYNPTLNKIINVAPLNIGDGKTAAVTPKTTTDTDTSTSPDTTKKTN